MFILRFRKRRDLRFDGILSCNPETNEVILSAAILDKEGSELVLDQNHQKILKLLKSNFDICVVNDNRTGEIILLHKSTKTLIISDLLYKSNPKMVGPGGSKHRYTHPEWFSKGTEGPRITRIFLGKDKRQYVKFAIFRD